MKSNKTNLNYIWSFKTNEKVSIKGFFAPHSKYMKLYQIRDSDKTPVSIDGENVLVDLLKIVNFVIIFIDAF